MKRTARDILQEKGDNLVSIGLEGTVYEALQKMTNNKVGSIVVVDNNNNDTIVGIWTERDLMYQVLEDGFDPKTAKVSENMSGPLISASADDQVHQLYDKFLGRRIRHLLIEENGAYIGLVSVGDVVKSNLQQKSEEFKELNEMVSFEYYETWREPQHDH